MLVRQGSHFQQVLRNLRFRVRHRDGLFQAPKAEVMWRSGSIQALVDFECVIPELVGFKASVETLDDDFLLDLGTLPQPGAYVADRFPLVPGALQVLVAYRNAEPVI